MRCDEARSYLKMEKTQNSINKLKRYLEKNDIEIIDHTNQKYTEGENLEILAVEEDAKLEYPIIKETKEPTILYKGQVVRKGKIILLTKKGKETKSDSDEK
jgi:hypothetical protein